MLILLSIAQLDGLNSLKFIFFVFYREGAGAQSDFIFFEKFFLIGNLQKLYTLLKYLLPTFALEYILSEVEGRQILYFLYTISSPSFTTSYPAVTSKSPSFKPLTISTFPLYSLPNVMICFFAFLPSAT